MSGGGTPDSYTWPGIIPAPFGYETQVFDANVPIQYLLKLGNVNKKYLIVAFSGFAAADSKYQKTYNYIRTLSDIDCNQLFIPDVYGPRGCYYLGEKGNFEVEMGVQALISHIAEQLSISTENIICVGSSKGGSAALYFGLKNNYGHVVAGAPQTRIADYIAAVCPKTTRYMLGENPSKELKETLNHLIENQLDKSVSTKIDLLSSEHDWQYADHIKPLLDKISQTKIHCNAVIDNRMKSHSEIAVFFPEFLKKSLLSTCFGIQHFSASLNSDNNSSEVALDLMVGENCVLDEISFFYSFRTTAKEYFYISKDSKFVFVPDHPGIFECTAGLAVDEQRIYTLHLGTVTLGKQFFNLSGTKLSKQNQNLYFSLELDALETLEYAFYILKEKTVVSKRFYQKEMDIVHPITKPGTYSIQYFIRTPDGTTTVGQSESITFTEDDLPELREGIVQ